MENASRQLHSAACVSRGLTGMLICLLGATLLLQAAGGCGGRDTGASPDAEVSPEACRIIQAVLAKYAPEGDEKESVAVASLTLEPRYIRSEVSSLPTDHRISAPVIASTGIGAMVSANQSRRVVPVESLPSSFFFVAAQDDLDSTFRHCYHGWRRFHARFPETTCLLRVSWPGISADGTRAAVYVTWFAQDLVGDGTIMLLEKKDGEWQVVDSIGMFVS